jgi:Ca-activated chloride channel family protein
MINEVSATEYQNWWYFYLGVVVASLWLFNRIGWLRSAELIFPFSLKGTNNDRSLLNYVIPIISSLAIIIIGYAATGPRKPLGYQQEDIEANDIFVVFDVSRSMLADDIPPNRLEVSKQKFREFVRLKPKDRIGIILFSEKVFTLLPLTTDLQLLDRAIADINIGYLGSGTNIGDGIALAVARLAESPAKNKVIIMMTDGVSNVGNMTPLEAAQIAKNFGIKIYTIGVGTDGTARIPIGNSGIGQRYQNIPGGSIDMEGLEKISLMTGAKAYYANSEKVLSDVLNEINNLEKTKIKSEGRIVYDEQYYKYLIIGMLLLGLSEFVRLKVLREIV